VTSRRRTVVGSVLALALLALLFVGFVGLPRDGAALPSPARRALVVALPQWHTTEPVNEVVYGTRAFDTFGETFLLLAAIDSVTVLTRPREERKELSGEEEAGQEEQREIDPQGGEDHPEQERVRRAEDREQAGRARPMTVVVRGGVRVAAPLLAVAGAYLCAWGYSPGGGFPAGVVLAGVVLYVYAAFGYQRVRRFAEQNRTELVEMVGALAVVVVLGLGLVLRGSFSANWLPLTPVGTIRSGGVLQAFSVSELVEVSSGLVIAILGLLQMKHDWSPDEDPRENRGRRGSEHGAGS